MEPRIQYARSKDGVKLAYWMLGAGGTPLLMTSPLGYSNISMEWQIPELRAWYERLSRGRLLVRYDNRGSGMSQRGVEDLSFRASVDDLETIASLIDQPFDLAGLMGSGMWAISFTARHPERVRRLVLWSCPVDEWKPRQREQLQAALSLAERNWDLAVETFTHVSIGWSRGRIAHGWANYIRATITREDFLRSWQEWLNIPSTELMAMLPTITAPTLIIDQDFPGVGRRHARIIASEVPNAELVRIEGGPTAAFENAQGMRALEEFLSDGGPPPPQIPKLDFHSGTAIILFADIVDSTSLTERLGDAAFREKARELDTALRTIILEHAGTPIEGKLLGDGVLATFASAKQAIEAALACGRAGEDGGLPLHLGLHAGDVIHEDNNVYGGAVNIAARVSGLSAPGEVLVSETVRSLARTSAGVTFEDRGERELRGVSEPVRVWAVLREPQDERGGE